MHQLLTAKQADTYRPFQDLESKKLIYDLLNSPEKFNLHNRRYSNSGSSPSPWKIANQSYYVGCIWTTNNG